MHRHSSKPEVQTSEPSGPAKRSCKRVPTGRPIRPAFRTPRRRSHQYASLWRKTPVQLALWNNPLAYVSTAALDQTDVPLPALDTWDRVQDLLLRASRFCPVQVQATVCGSVSDFGSCTLIFSGFKGRWWEGKALAVRHALLDTDSYVWEQDGRSGSFLNLLEYQGSDLVVHLASWSVLKACPDGQSLVCVVLALLNQLSRVEVTA